MEQRKTPIKNICMLSTHGYFDPVPQLGRTDTGGQVVYVLQLAKALSERKIRVDIYTRWFEATKKQVGPVPDSPDVRIIRIPAGPWEFIPKEKIYDILPELTKNMIEFIRNKNLQYDLLHGHYVDAGIVAVDVGKALNKPVFFTPHSLGAWKRELMGGDSEEMESKFNFNHRICEERRICESVNGIAVTSVVQEEKLEQLYGFKSSNVVNLPPGTNIHVYQPLMPGEKKIKTSLPDRYIFCLSRIDSNKGHDFLLNAFDIVRKKMPGVSLVIGGGSPNPQKRELEVLCNIQKIIDEKGMNETVRIIGYVPDEFMVPYYRQAELFVLPSVFEPFGMTASEAMACGTPVVASQFGGIRNVISSGDNGLLVDPSHSEEFAEAMINLLRNKELAERLGKRGCEMIRREYSWEVMASRHIEFYKKFMNGI
jgi:mannosylfructose-phosphate synthase